MTLDRLGRQRLRAANQSKRGTNKASPTSLWHLQAAAGHGHEHVLLVHSSGLGELGLLGQDIIPPERLVTPHLQRRLQAPAPGAAYINSAPLPVSREASGGDHESPAVPLNRTPPTMIFSDLYKSPRSPLSKLRNSFPHAVPPPSDIDADLVSRDKAKQKEAVRKYLAEKVRNDWEFVWPPLTPSAPTNKPPDRDGAPPSNGTPASPQDVAENGNPDGASAPATGNDDAPRDPGEEADSESDAESVYSTISEDPVHFRPRAEWASDLSDDDDEPHVVPCPFRFANPEAVGKAVRTSIETKRTRRRRALREEATWNHGLACFEARRNAWTGARTVRVKPKPPAPVSPTSTRRIFWRHHRTESSASHTAGTFSGSPPAPTSPLRPTTTRNSQQTDTSSEPDSARSGGGVQSTAFRESTGPPSPYPVETLLPVPPPLLPPQNPMRASVTPSMYASLYDKVVVQSLQPSCPVNLSDMLRACVVGWKRDGEWPPKSSYPTPVHISAQATAAELLVIRQRKQHQQQQQQNAITRKQAPAPRGNTTAVPASRRLSLVGLLGGGGNKAASGEKPAQEEKEKSKEGKENQASHSHSHSDEGGGSSSKALFRRSLQKVFSLGQHQHHPQPGHGNTGGGVGANGDATSPLSPSTKEVNAAG
ncbi:hypothetical protein MMYC01_202124 [Madurella mycetomatis]|uniref:Gag1-like clamp domain-containing protein n=1 Tax=Madurella mycetomatis TaxID=100816 RepID=A0A175WAB5_9PEZI|nr:hypothetical protein MMYC01_202124 [Madurella mycetomatis]